MFVLAAAMSLANDTWTGMYIQGQKIGWSSTIIRDAGKENWTRSESRSVISSSLLGSALSMRMESISDFDEKGRIRRMVFVMDSGGRTLRVDADFQDTQIVAKSVSGGQSTDRIIPIPQDAVVVEDPSVYLLEGGEFVEGRKVEFHIFDPNTLSLIKGSAEVMGMEQITVSGAKVVGRKILVNDPRAALTLYIDEQGEMIKSVGPMGIEMIAEPKEKAMALPDAGSAKPVDIAESSAIRPDKPISNWTSRKALTLRVTGADLSRLPSGGHQTVTQEGDAWIVKLHPINPADTKNAPKVGKTEGMEEWLKPDIRVPSDDPVIIELAGKLIDADDSVLEAAEKARSYVHDTVLANAGIGVMRDAKEILETKEGVCRDHAVVMAAILRAAKVPARLVSGLVYANGRFYYHAWVEVWSGERWIGYDSTRSMPMLTVGHIKLAQGTVADAFSAFLIDGAKIEVIGDNE